jgi:hypothetical protein
MKINKKMTRGEVVKRLDSIFSKWVRLRGAKITPDGRILNKCCTCGVVQDITKMDAGHYISRGKYATRWSEDNVFPQCKRCNIFLKGNYTSYALFMIKTYGYSKLQELDRRSKSTEKIYTYELMEKIEYYKEKVKGIERVLHEKADD